MKRVNKLNSEKTEIPLGNKEISEEKLKTVLEQIKVFCKIAYQLYSERNGTDKTSDNEKELKTDPPDEFTNAA